MGTSFFPPQSVNKVTLPFDCLTLKIKASQQWRRELPAGCALSFPRCCTSAEPLELARKSFLKELHLLSELIFLFSYNEAERLLSAPAEHVWGWEMRADDTRLGSQAAWVLRWVCVPVLGAWQRGKMIPCAGCNALSFPMPGSAAESSREANTRTHRVC